MDVVVVVTQLWTLTMSTLLGVPAVRQVLARLQKSESLESEIIRKLERSAIAFDSKKQRALTVDEWHNVLRLQHHIDITKTELAIILEPIVKKDGRVDIEAFFRTDIHSPAAFKAMDRNKDGYITKGELKLAKKDVKMADIDECIRQHDLDGDGKLDLHEFQISANNTK